MFPETARDEGFGNDDEEYIPDYEVGDNEDVASLKAPITKSTLKGPSSKRRCMSDFLAKQQQQAEPRKQHQKVDQQHQSLPYHKEKVSMMANNDLEPNTQNQFYDEGAANSIEHGVDFPLFLPSFYHQQQQKVQQNHVQQQQEKKMLTKYCAPGSMSSYRALRLKQMQRMSHQNENETPKKKKGRGPTKLPHVHARKMNERPVMILNSHGQPIGPTKKLVSEYSLFLGTLARNPEFLPLNYCDWPNIPDHDKDKVWEYVQVSVTPNLTFRFMYTLRIIATN
ncbi:putative acetyl-CoA decarbonylase/synthase complex subunit alpha-like [Bienertia sinuspersici]